MPAAFSPSASVHPSRSTNQFAAVLGRNSGSCARGGGARRAHGGARSAPKNAAVSVTAVIAFAESRLTFAAEDLGCELPDVEAKKSP